MTGAAVTPGQMLRDARVARGLSLDDVAESLRFSIRQIELIEQDNYAALPGATLVRGFVRSYAKYLRMDPQPLLDQLAGAVPAAADVRAPANIGLASDSAVREVISWRWLAIIAVALVVLVTTIYLFTETDMSLISSAETQTKPVDKATVGDAAGPSVAKAPETSVPETMQVLAANSVADGVTTPKASAEGEGVVTAGADGSDANKLLIEFDDLSWIEVRDATQSVVLVGEYPKGTRRAVDGRAPFSLWVGRASVVRVAYRGRSIDLKESARDDVARISVE